MNYFSTASGSVVSVPGVINATRFLGGDGSAAAPAFSFQSENSGWYKFSTGNIRVVGLGTAAATLAPGTSTFHSHVQIDTAKHLTMNAGGQILADAGTAAAPGMAFNGDTNLGLYRLGADQAGISANGALVVQFYPGTVEVGNNTITSRLYINEIGAAPAGVVDKISFFALDSGGKTVAHVRAGAAGTDVVLATEA